MVSKDSPKFYVNYKYIMIKRFNIIFFLVICSIAIPVYAQRVTLTFNDVSMSEALKGTVLDETGRPCPMPMSPAASTRAPVPATTRNPACNSKNNRLKKQRSRVNAPATVNVRFFLGVIMIVSIVSIVSFKF